MSGTGWIGGVTGLMTGEGDIEGRVVVVSVGDREGDAEVLAESCAMVGVSTSTNDGSDPPGSKDSVWRTLSFFDWLTSLDGESTSLELR